jgi:hypothetical protein
MQVLMKSVLLKAVDDWLKTTGSADLNPRQRQLLRQGLRRHFSR